MIIKGPWKLAADRTNEGLVPTFMTHLDDDPYEMSNLVNTKSVEPIRDQLLIELTRWDNNVRKT